MRDPATLTPDEWASVGVPNDPDAHTRRAFVWSACAVFDADFDPPLGFVHIERDDELAWFDDDEQAAANVSDDWRWYCPISQRMSPPCGSHPSTIPDMHEAYKGPCVNNNLWAHNPELDAWWQERDDIVGDDPACGPRVIVPVADAIEAGLLTDGESCPACGAFGGGPPTHHVDCPHGVEDRIPAALRAADEAFWAAIVEAFPQATGGDFPPGATMRFEQAAESALRTWLDYNLPQPEAAE